MKIKLIAALCGVNPETMTWFAGYQGSVFFHKERHKGE